MLRPAVDPVETVVRAGPVMVVDDDAAARALLRACIESHGYAVLEASGGEAALASMRERVPAVVVTDAMMPGLDGFQLCARMRADASLRHVPVLLCSGTYTDPDDQSFALAAGADASIDKAAPIDDLLRHLDGLVALGSSLRRRADDFPERHAGILSHKLEEKMRALERANAQLHVAMLATVQAMQRMVEARDPYTSGHQHRVGALAQAMGRELGLGESVCEGLLVGGYLHDVGKSIVPIEILARPGRLNELETAIVRCHPMAGYGILTGIDFPWPVAQMAAQHHERLDGKGYPHGLRGDAILPESRIIAVADVVEAISVHRPYRPALGIDVALAEIEGGRGVAYDPDAVDACLRLFRERGYHFD